MEFSIKERENFVTATQEISHNNEFTIKCPPNPHELMDESLKQKVSSKIYGSSNVSEEMNAVSHQELPKSKEDRPICLDFV